MDPSRMAKMLGSRGGRARARRLSEAERRRIASLGGKARARSLEAARRILNNLRYANAVIELRGGVATVKATKSFAGPFPASIVGEVEVPDPQQHLETVGAVLHELRGVGFEPILVGGMALVLIGSRRVTADFDFVIAHPGERLPDLVNIFYEHRLELASRLNEAGDVMTTIDNPRAAAIRLRSDAPSSAFFYNRTSGLRIDLRFDFPIPAATLAVSASRLKLPSLDFTIASESDLLTLKRIATKDRSYPGDAQDIAFLEARRRRRKK